MRSPRFSALALGILVAAACAPRAARPPIRLATTTSVENSGLLGEILPAFERRSGYHVQVVAVGSGQALRRAADGDADLCFVHSPEDEERFVAAGDGIDRGLVMRNAFVIVGPKDDPAGCRGKTAVAAFRSIAATKSVFVSRGDDSGTHKKEKAIWRDAGATLRPPAYVESGRDMASTLMLADERRAYTLSDIATYSALRSKIEIEVLVDRDPFLDNPYSVIRTSPERHAGLNEAGARVLADWLCGPDGQSAIGAFRRDGRPVFFPAASRE